MRHILFPLIFLALASASQAQLSRAQFARTMEFERANTRAIRDSIKLVNRKSNSDVSAHWTQPIVDSLKRVGSASVGDEQARYEALDENRKQRVLIDLANQGYGPAQSDLGAAMLNGDMGFKADARQALRYLVPAAKSGDAIAAYNAGIAYQRVGDDQAAIPFLEQAAASKVTGAAYKLSLAALFARDLERAVKYGRQATTERSALGAYAVCLSAEFKNDTTLRAEFCPLAFDFGYADAAEDAGIGLANVGHWDKAYSYFAKCIAQNNSPSCQRNGGMSLFKLDRWEEADKLLSASMSAGDDNDDARMMLALIAIHGKTKQWEKADSLLEAVIKKGGPRSAEAHFHLCYVYDQRPDRTYTGEEIDAHLLAAARGGYKEAQDMLRQNGKSW